jgi:hypothetical protein
MRPSSKDRGRYLASAHNEVVCIPGLDDAAVVERHPDIHRTMTVVGIFRRVGGSARRIIGCMGRRSEQSTRVRLLNDSTHVGARSSNNSCSVDAPDIGTKRRLHQKQQNGGD